MPASTSPRRSALVLLHGAPGDGRLWAPVVAAMRSEVEVLTPTLRWFGSDPWDDDGSAFGTRAHAAQVIALLESLGRPAALAAWSYSAHVALKVLLDRPELVTRALLYEPGLHTYLRDPGELAAFGEDARAAFGPVAEALRARGAEAAVQGVFAASGAPDLLARLPAARRERYLASARILPLLMGQGEPPAPISADDLGRVATPVTVAVGERTRPMFALASRAVARELPSGTLAVVPDAGHLLPETDPERFGSLLDGWLEG